MKKLVVLIFALTMVAFAQDTYAPEATSVSQQDDVSAYTSGAPAPETPLVNINETKSDEPVFFVSFHPMSLLILSLVDFTGFYVTLEGNVGPAFGLVVRPVYLNAEASDSDEKLELSEYGAALGLRYYFNPKHQGFYVEPRVEYLRIDGDYTEKYHYDDATVTGNAFGVGALAGFKATHGHFTMFMDAGYEYYFISVTGRQRDDIEDAATIGGGYDINLGIGFAI